MATYKDSGVDIEAGDECSALAYQAAKNTFVGRKGMIGEPVIDDGGFTGFLDMGDFYLVQNDDGVGTKIMIAEKINKFDTLGYDLVAMVADDAACVGAETISMTNTIDVDKVDANKVRDMMAGLESAAIENKIAIVGGEIAELSKMVNGYVWNSTSVGIIEKDRVISGKDIEPGDKIIGFRSAGLRSNGFSLVRHILDENLGEGWAFEKYDMEMTWGEVALTPSRIYCSTVMELHGRYKEKPLVELKGLAHITGGGIEGNLKRVLKSKGLGANLDNLPEPHEIMTRLIEMGNVKLEEAYNTWNMGVGLIAICNDFEKVEEVCKKRGIEVSVIGEVTDSGKIAMKI